MTTVLRSLQEDSEQHQMLHDMFLGTFLEGKCYPFAMALNQGLGWPMVGLMKGTVIWHAGVRAPDGRIHDIRGPLSEEEFGQHFLSPPFNIREVTAEELYPDQTDESRVIKQARQVAEALWPDLPWISTHAMKVQAFADELEALSRKHGLWVCAEIPARPPLVCTGDGEEGGYLARPTLNGQAYTIARYFPFEIKDA